MPVQQPESHSHQASLESHPQPVQFENLHEEDSHSSESDSESDSGAISFKYPPTGKTPCKYGPVFALYLYRIESNRVNTVQKRVHIYTAFFLWPVFRYSFNPDLEQTISPGNRTRYGRIVNPPKQF